MRRLALACALAVLVAGACGGGGDDDADAPPGSDAVTSDGAGGGDGGGDGGGLTPLRVCSMLCAKVEECFGDRTSCDENCGPDLQDCSADELERLTRCSDAGCGTFQDCTFSEACFQG